MASCDGIQRQTHYQPELSEDLVQLAARLDVSVVVVRGPVTDLLPEVLPPDCTLDRFAESELVRLCRQMPHDGRAEAIAVGEHGSIVLSTLVTEAYRARILTYIELQPRAARKLVEIACEATRLSRQASRIQVKLDATSLQLSQNFEEHCWLRDLARNLSISNETANANVLARAVLGPLLDLLHAEDLYLLVRDEETVRSGLASGCFGSAQIPIHQISHLVQDLLVEKHKCPLIRNNVQLLGGRVRSLAIVALVTGDRLIGHLVAINRLAQHVKHLPQSSSAEFCAVELGLMEEACGLLSTQTHNIRLVLESQHLALGTMQAMSRAIDARDPYTRGHSERVARLAFEIAEILGLEETACQEVYVAGILHDVGKIGVPDRVLLKAGSLTEEEFDIIKQHPEIGYQIIEQLGKLHFTLPGVLYHHERWDGHGYPHQLAGDDIPLMARIIAVADSFDAMTSSRPYRSAMPLAKALEIIHDGAGKQWDAMLVRCFDKWHQQRSKTLPQLAATGLNLIPQEPPYADITQSILALQM